MRRPGRSEHVPLFRRHRLRVTDRETLQNAECLRIAHRLANATGDPAARARHDIAQRRRREPCIAWVVAHITGRTDAFTKQLRFVVYATGIRKAVATLQSHDELPQLARLRCAYGAIPNEANSRRDTAARLHHIEQELRISGRVLRERGHVTAHEQVLSLQRRRQIAGRATGGAQPRPAQAREQRRDELESPDERQRDRGDQQTDCSMPVRQLRQTVDAARPQQKCECKSPHPDLPV